MLTEECDGSSKRTHMPIPSPVATVLPDIARSMETPGDNLAAKIFAAAVATTINVFGTTPEAIRSAFGALLLAWIVDSFCGAKIASLMGQDKAEYHRKRLLRGIAYLLVITVFGGAAMMGHEWFLLQTGVSALCGAQFLSMLKTVQTLGTASGIDLSAITDIFKSITASKEKEVKP